LREKNRKQLLKEMKADSHYTVCKLWLFMTMKDSKKSNMDSTSLMNNLIR